MQVPDGPRRLTVVWVVRDELEAVATDGETVYVVGSEVNAVRASDGSRSWRYEGPRGEPLHASGGVTIGKSADGALEVFAPFEYDLKLDTPTGSPKAFDNTSVGDPPSGFTPLSAAPLRDFLVDRRGNSTPELTVSDAAGRLLATLKVDTPNFSEPAPLQVGDVLVVSLASGDVPGLRLHS
jgi:hypothetical protein